MFSVRRHYHHRAVRIVPLLVGFYSMRHAVEWVGHIIVNLPFLSRVLSLPLPVA